MRRRLKSETAGQRKLGADRGRALRARHAMDMWTMRLRRTGGDRGQRAAARLRCPPAAAFDHMPTAFDR